MIITGKTMHMTDSEAADALALADVGDNIIYATGDLAFDADGAGSAVEQIQAVRAFIYAAYESGAVQPFQRRLTEGKFEYRARKLKNVALPAVKKTDAQSKLDEKAAREARTRLESERRTERRRKRAEAVTAAVFAGKNAAPPSVEPDGS